MVRNAPESAERDDGESHEYVGDDFRWKVRHGRISLA